MSGRKRAPAARRITGARTNTASAAARPAKPPALANGAPMGSQAAADATAIGFRAKTGWAAVVLLAGPVGAPRVLDSRRIELCDPDQPASRQPYHAGFGTFQEDDAEVKRLVGDVRRFAARALGGLVGEYARAGHSPLGSAIVAGSEIDPARIGNLHLRAHALEGRLYRKLIEEGLAAADLRCEVLVERDLWQRASARLRTREEALRKAVTDLGRGVAGGWRAESKAAALAAWLALAGESRADHFPAQA
jgi:hypothetical protein